MRAWVLLLLGTCLTSACGSSPGGVPADGPRSVDGTTLADAEAAPDGAAPTDGGSAEVTTSDGADGDGREVAATCPPAAVSAAELASTPRADVNLELLALKLSPGKIIADEATYQRVVRDVGAIRAKKPEVANIGFFPVHDGRSLVLAVPLETAEQVRAGTYHEWDCLNDTYGVVLPFNPIGSAAPVYGIMKLEGIYAMNLLTAEYGRLPGIARAELNVTVGDGSTICVTSGSATWHYVFDAASGDCAAGCNVHTYRHFTTETDGTVTVLETFDTQSATAPPAWVTQFASRAACR